MFLSAVVKRGKTLQGGCPEQMPFFAVANAVVGAVPPPEPLNVTLDVTVDMSKGGNLEVRQSTAGAALQERQIG
jgi:hypothetical protein